MSRPQAYERERVISGKDAGGKTVTMGTETVRGARCTDHGVITEQFLGVNQYGWIFRCRGTRETPESAHAFVAQPSQQGQLVTS